LSHEKKSFSTRVFTGKKRGKGSYYKKAFRFRFLGRKKQPMKDRGTTLKRKEKSKGKLLRGKNPFEISLATGTEGGKTTMILSGSRFRREKKEGSRVLYRGSYKAKMCSGGEGWDSRGSSNQREKVKREKSEPC